ncbi:MAG: NADH-quinone oxidoreductase subunit C, partial [Candidatus Methanomethylophilaceae archaeon]|nr:NADH-quinone oxidoreductase subunit C [Candidatus Methanomethylophilaceae archaeon]
MEKGHMIAFAPVSGSVRRLVDDVITDPDQFQDLYAFYRGRHGRLCGLYVVPEQEGNELRVIISPSRGHLVNLRMPIGDRYQSLSRRFPEASWFERALAERDGVIPEGHPDLRPIRTRHPDGRWIEPITGGQDDYFLPAQQDGHMQVPVGPVHAGIIGSGHFRFHVQGESTEAMQVMLGYCYRGMESMLTHADPSQAIRLVERISGDNGVAHALAYCQALEGDLELPFRARCLRTILSELERLHNHLGDLGGIALDVAFMLPAQRLFAL